MCYENNYKMFSIYFSSIQIHSTNIIIICLILFYSEEPDEIIWLYERLFV